MVPTNTALAGDVHRFIERFTEHGPQVERCFCHGCCYWFAWVLTERFPGAEVVYDALSNHFAAQIGERVYDITGDVTDRALSPWQLWAGYEEGSRARERCPILSIAVPPLRRDRFFCLRGQCRQKRK